MISSRRWFIFLAAFFAFSLVKAEPRGDERSTAIPRSVAPPRTAPAPRPVNRPMVINIQRPAGTFSVPQARQGTSVPRQSHNPSYGQLNRPQAGQGAVAILHRPGTYNGMRPHLGKGRPSGTAPKTPHAKFGVVAHHHPYSSGYVRKKLQKIGVSSEPSYITDRSEIAYSPRGQSQIPRPSSGPGSVNISGPEVSPRNFNDPMVRNQMGLLSSGDWGANLDQICQSETAANFYFWHHDPSGVDYCHYVDSSGFHWFGWYSGTQNFWTRYYAGRWWIYDSDYDRWCFWNNNFWWWQDPNHIGDLYCYNNDDYVPCNSSEDQIAVTVPDDAGAQSYASPDGSRMIKIMPGASDAFLYDGENPPSFDPVYLASGVQSVEFSDPNNGRPLQIMLKLSDGSYDMFDSQGGSYNPGTDDADQALGNSNDNADGAAGN